MFRQAPAFMDVCFLNAPVEVESTYTVDWIGSTVRVFRQ
jgi:hypothetical protein